MKRWLFEVALACAAMLWVGTISWADAPDGTPGPFSLAPTTQPSGPPELSTAGTDNSDQGIYVMPQPPLKGQGTNLGGVNFDLNVSYFNQYVYRGVDHSIGQADTNGVFSVKGSTLNLQVDSRLEFNLGTLPHPFVGIFTDVYDADPVDHFQEVRPTYGAVWTVKPFTLTGGGNTYIYPGRDNLDTAEFFGDISFNDSFVWHTADPVFSPYYYAAYDYDKNKGWYMEGGVTHDIPLEDLGVTFTFQADMAYIIGYQQQFVFINQLHDTGLQHYDVGMKLRYSINHLLNLNQQFGQFDIVSSLFYTGVINGNLTGNNILWGGVGIGFSY